MTLLMLLLLSSTPPNRTGRLFLLLVLTRTFFFLFQFTVILSYHKIDIGSDQINMGMRSEGFHEFLEQDGIELGIGFDNPQKVLGRLLQHRRQTKGLKEVQAGPSERCQTTLFLHKAGIHQMYQRPVPVVLELLNDGRLGWKWLVLLEGLITVLEELSNGVFQPGILTGRDGLDRRGGASRSLFGPRPKRTTQQYFIVVASSWMEVTVVSQLPKPTAAVHGGSTGRGGGGRRRAPGGRVEGWRNGKPRGHDPKSTHKREGGNSCQPTGDSTHGKNTTTTTTAVVVLVMMAIVVKEPLFDGS